MHGRRYSDGLHEAIEIKENVVVGKESQTQATITIQNYFRMYSKLAGMTGTALTEAQEFMEIYKLDVIEIPTNVPITRKDHNDYIYRSRREKFNAVIIKARELSDRGQPVLVGTTSVEESEVLSKMLKNSKIDHNVLNAKQHQREAEIISRAGQKGSITISTNMDIDRPLARDSFVVVFQKPITAGGGHQKKKSKTKSKSKTKKKSKRKTKSKKKKSTRKRKPRSHNKKRRTYNSLK